MPSAITSLEIADSDDLGAVLEAMAEFAESGSGWLNIQPEIPPENQPPAPSVLTQWARRNSPDAALGTWTPADPSSPDSRHHVGIQHHLGNRIIPLFDQLGVERPDGWRRVQDSPRRGLVMTTPHDESLEVILNWLMALSRAASTVASTGRWSVALHRSLKR